MSDEGYFYAMTAFCVGGCGRKILGPTRQESDPDWTEEQHAEFDAMVSKAGWTQTEEQKGTPLWKCPGPCDPPFVFDPNEFSIPAHMKRRVKLVRPEFFGKCNVKSD